MRLLLSLVVVVPPSSRSTSALSFFPAKSTEPTDSVLTLTESVPFSDDDSFPMVPAHLPRAQEQDGRRKPTELLAAEAAC